MELGCIGVPLELKFAGDEKPAGYFEGYGAVFGNVDQGGDLIERGAFAKSLSKGCRPGMYYNHDRKAGTIGVWDDVGEDVNGLIVKGRIIGLDTEQGKMNMARLREGAIKGLSIGYRVPPHGARRGSGKMGEPSRIFKEIDLKEVSVVDDPMNPLARLNFVKSAQWTENSPADEIRTIREFERFLRDVGGFSRAAAEQIAIGGFKAQPYPRDEDDVGEHIRKRMSALAGILAS